MGGWLWRKAGDMKKCAWCLLYKDGETLGSTRSGWWGINKGDVNVDVEGESEYQHTGTRRTMKMQA